MAAFERATVGLILWWSASNTFAAGPAGAVSATRADVDETVERIEADARSRGLLVLGRTNYTADARSNGLRIPPVSVLQVAREDGRAPARYVVWRAPNGTTVVDAGAEPADSAWRPSATASDVAADLASRSEVQ